MSVITLSHRLAFWTCILLVSSLAACSVKDEASNVSGVHRLDPGGNYIYTDPAWSPISEEIIYSRYEESPSQLSPLNSTGEIFKLDIKTKQTVRLTSNDVRDFNPAWSPDAQKIVYIREYVGYDQARGHSTFTDTLRIMNSDGSEDKELYTCPFACGMPSWSPDGMSIAVYASDGLKAVSSTSEPPSNIYIVNVDRREPVQITRGDTQALGPKWSSDGKYLAYTMPNLNKIGVIDMLTRSVRTYELPNLKYPLPSIAWTSDKKRIIFPATDRGTGHLSAYVLDLGNGETSPLFISADKQILLPYSISLSPNEGELVLNESGVKLFGVDLDR